jgi:pimeloyl-ACP methyl ester carboxylesterase
MTGTPTTVSTHSGIRLCHDTFGDPDHPPLLLIQGLGAQMVGWHRDLCTRLADAGFYVIRHDNRDIGLSQRFPAGGYTLEDMAQDSAELITALDLPSVHVVGQSMGGMIAQEIAINHPEMVRSLTLIYTCARADHLHEEVITGRMDRPPPHDRAEAIEDYVQSEAPAASPAYPLDEAWIRELGGIMYDRDYEPAGTERDRAEIHASRDRRAPLRTITVPTAILHGDSDNLIDPAGATELHDLIRDSTLTIYPGLGHSLPRELWNDIVHEIRSNTARAGTAG